MTTARIILLDAAYNSEQQTVDLFAVPAGTAPADVLAGWIANQPAEDTEGNSYRCTLSTRRDEAIIESWQA